MKQKTRYPLLIGLLIAFIEFFIFSLGHFASLKVEFNTIILFLFIMSFSALIFITLSFKLYPLKSKEFKKKRKISWTATVLITIYWMYLLIAFAMGKYTNAIIVLSHIIIILGSILLIIIGNLMQILDESLEYIPKKENNNEKN